MEECQNTQIFNLTFNQNNIPLCLNSELQNLYFKKREIIDNYHLNFSDNSGYTSFGLLDYLFYTSPQLPNPSIFWVQRPEDLVNFNNYIEFAKNLRCERFNLTTSYCQANIANSAQQKIEDLIDILTQDVKSKFKFDGKDNNVELVDIETKNININTYFISTD
jgi:hypothetical protein